MLTALSLFAKHRHNEDLGSANSTRGHGVTGKTYLTGITPITPNCVKYGITLNTPD